MTRVCGGGGGLCAAVHDAAIDGRFGRAVGAQGGVRACVCLRSDRGLRLSQRRPNPTLGGVAASSARMAVGWNGAMNSVNALQAVDLAQ